MNQVAPILSTLRRHKLAVFLISMQIALACAVLINALDLVTQRWQAVNEHSGVEEAAIGSVSLDGFTPEQAEEFNTRVMGILQHQPGIRSAAVTNSLPFGQRAGTAGITLDQEGKQQGGVVDFYVGGPGSIETLGLKLVRGRLPASDEYARIDNFMPVHPVALLTRSLAEHLWPGQSPLSKIFYGIAPTTVIGVVDDYVIPTPGGRGPNSTFWSVFIPAQPGPQLAGNYAFRADSKAMPAIMHALPDALARAAPEAVLNTKLTRPLSQLREDYYADDRHMLALLMGVIVVMLAVTAFGIVGLASFWVQQRTKQIGVRRALGATRGDILHYFQTENFLIVSGGVVLGMTLAFAINQLLMAKYELPRLPLFYLPIGAVVLWLLGQLAVLWPALRAAAIPPATATRSV